MPSYARRGHTLQSGMRLQAGLQAHLHDRFHLLKEMLLAKGQCVFSQKTEKHKQVGVLMLWNLAGAFQNIPHSAEDLYSDLNFVN
jgi:hypothetical protein